MDGATKVEQKRHLEQDLISSVQQQKLRNSFPIDPYDIQMQISSKIYSALNKQKTKFMIVESPTGTGKSYSLLAPILAWLSQNKYRSKVKKQVKKQNQQNIKIPAFLIKKQTEGQSLEVRQNKLKSQQQNKKSFIVDIQQIVKSHKIKSKNVKEDSGKSQGKISFEELDVDDCQNKMTHKDIKRKINKQQQFIERQINLQKQDIPVKLIFVSRTHSQLEQIVKSTQQIKKKIQIQSGQQLLALSLGSKDLLCCNPEIKKLNTNQNQSISQKCQYLLNHSSCQYSHSHLIKQFLGKSIQEAKKLSQVHKLCGYYGLKNLIDCSDILFVPYSSLVSSQIRSKIGININNSIIVFDEGHNLMDFIKNSLSTEIIYFEVTALIQKITLYLKKYGQKMKSQNKNTLQHFIHVLQSILLSMNRFYSQKFTDNNKQNYLSLSVLDLIVDFNIKDLRLHKIENLFYLLDYDKKVAFFQPEPKVKTHNKFNKDQNSVSVGQIHKIINWIKTLYQISEEKIIVLVKSNQQKGDKNLRNLSFKLFCLYSEELQKIIQSSRLTICAGGTMQPLSDFQQILNKSSYHHEIVKVGHIINPSQCRIFCIKKYENKQIKFNHQNLNSQTEIKFLQKVIISTLKNIISSSPLHEGIIVFIQSYKLISMLKQSLGKQVFYQSILFDSQKEGNENIFQAHSQKISNKQRSILISVMGGKLSEGINFSDNLARKLIIFGLPYPNVKSPQIVQQMKYYDQLMLPNINGQIYYESLCLKAINQTIGRAIRHKNDWAEIFLIDARFQTVKNKLSQWMRKSIKVVADLQRLNQEIQNK